MNSDIMNIVIITLPIIILGFCGWSLGWLFSDIKNIVRIIQASEEDAKVYDKDGE